jgi:hypothetical protein
MVHLRFIYILAIFIEAPNDGDSPREPPTEGDGVHEGDPEQKAGVAANLRNHAGHQGITK